MKNFIQVSDLIAWENKFHTNVGTQIKYSQLVNNNCKKI